MDIKVNSVRHLLTSLKTKLTYLPKDSLITKVLLVLKKKVFSICFI